MGGSPATSIVKRGKTETFVNKKEMFESAYEFDFDMIGNAINRFGVDGWNYCFYEEIYI